LKTFTMRIGAAAVYCFANAAHADSLCRKDETVYFSCKVNNSEKMISLCGHYPSNVFDFDDPIAVLSQKAFLTYRFGAKERIELEYPQRRKDSLYKFEGVSISSHFGGSYEVYFRNGKFVYEVFASGGEAMSYGVNIFDKNPFATPMKTVACQPGTATQTLPELVGLLLSIGSTEIVKHPANHPTPQ